MSWRKGGKSIALMQARLLGNNAIKPDDNTSSTDGAKMNNNTNNASVTPNSQVTTTETKNTGSASPSISTVQNNPESFSTQASSSNIAIGNIRPKGKDILAMAARSKVVPPSSSSEPKTQPPTSTSEVPSSTSSAAKTSAPTSTPQPISRPKGKDFARMAANSSIPQQHINHKTQSLNHP